MSAADPIKAMMLQSLMAKIAQGQGGGGPGSPGGPTPMAGGAGGVPGASDGMTVASPADDQSDQLSKELSVMRTADPGMVTQELTSIKKRIVTLLNHTAMSLPAVARGLSKALQPIDASLKASGEAAMTMATVAGGPSASQMGVSGPPLGTSALPPGMSGGAGAPGQPGMAS